MDITRKSATAIGWDTGSHGKTRSFSPPIGAADGDFIIVFVMITCSTLTRWFVSPSGDSDERTIPDETFFNARAKPTLPAASGDDLPWNEVWSGDGSVASGPRIQVFTRFYDPSDTLYGFEIGVFDDADNDIIDDVTVDGAEMYAHIITMNYENVAKNGTIEFIDGFGLDLYRFGRRFFELTKDDCMMIQATIGNTSDPVSPEPSTIILDSFFPEILSGGDSDVEIPVFSSNVPVSQTPWLTETRLFNSEYAVGENLAGAAGTYNIAWKRQSDSSASDTTYHVFLAINNDANGSSAPLGPLTPSTPGSGYIVDESPEVNARIVEIWSYDSEIQSIKNATNQLSVPVLSGGTFIFNGVGACISGEAIFTVDPIRGAFNRHILRFKIDSPDLSEDEYYFSALASNSQRDAAGDWRIELKGLFKILSEGRVGNITDTESPTLAGVFEQSLVLFTGNTVSVVADSVDAEQTWRQVMESRLGNWSDAFWGVEASLNFIQGRPQDGNYAILNYGNTRKRMEMLVEPAAVNDYVTDWWADNGGTILNDSRDDLFHLTPRVSRQSSLNSGGSLVRPAGAIVPYMASQSRMFKYYGFAKPPIKVVNIPYVGQQYVVSSRVEITPNKEGSAGTITSTLYTSALPVKKK